MRIKVLIISSLLLLALFAIKSYSVDWDNSDGQSADDLLSSGSDNIVSPSYTQEAQASRTAQIGPSGNDIISTSSGNKLSSGTANPQEARSQDQNLTAPTPTVATPTADVNVKAKPAVSSELAIVSGSWSLDLNDSASRKAILTLFQNGDAVYGTGNLNLDANTAMTAAASGTVTDDQVNLDIVSLGKVSLYRISMTVSGDSATGNYTTFSPGLPPSKGTAKGSKLVS
ncbi:MAG: hypothetical protein ABR985_11860 [Methanotrichaceae archaeon]|jgi:hypothetical protein